MRKPIIAGRLHCVQILRQDILLEQKAAAKKAAAKKAAAKKAADKKKKKQKPSSNVQLNAGGQFSGQGTFYFQNGNYGSCGQKNPDSAVIVAVNTPQGQ